MKKIRQSSFETNSSSAHSISLGVKEGKEFILDTIYPDENGIITLIGGEFGWQWEKSNDPETKANYAAASLGDLDTLFRVIKDHTQCEEVIYEGSSNYNSENWSYVDHQSHNVCPSDYDELKEFIFNKNSWLFLGNDNETANSMFYDVPTFTDKSKILPKYKYELRIDHIKDGMKFREFPTEDELDSAFHFLCGKYVMLETGLVSKSLYDQLDLKRKERFTYYHKNFDAKNNILYFVRDFDEVKLKGESSEEFRMKRSKYHNLPENFRSLKFAINEIPKR